MIEDKFYRCIPELNKECKKNNCYINGGDCEMTIYKEYSLKGLLEEIERLNNIIAELEKWLRFFNENGLVIDLEEGKQTTVMPTLAILEKIQELKGSDKE